MALDPLTEGLTLGDDLVSLIKQVCPDTKAQAQLVAAMQDKLASVAQASDATQATIMAAEAAQSGWINKPHLAGAWVCLGALVIDALVGLGIFISYAVGHPIPEPPKFMTEQVTTLMGGLFSLGGITVAHGLTKQWMATP